MRPARGKHRIQSVADATGVSPATLRAWERRYGFPVPERSSSSYRLYSDRDVDMIRRMRELCDQGMAPSQAAQVVHSEVTASGGREVTSGADPFELAQTRMIDAIEDFDPVELEDEIRFAMFLAQPEVIYERILGPVMARIGDGWEAGQYSVAQEHLTSHVLGAAMQDMLRLIQPRQRDRRVLLACVADEEHELPLFGVGFRLAAWGIYSVILGARTPPSAIAHAREQIDPHLIGLSVTMEIERPQARSLFDDYGSACAGTPWIVGGRQATAVRKLVEKAGGEVFEGDDLDLLRPRAEALIAAARRQ